MLSLARAVPLAGCLLFLGPGCAHLIETRTIAHFTKALQSDDLDRLKAVTSSEFEQKALRRPEAVEDLKILRLYPDPQTGKKKATKTEIVKVEDVSDDEKLVTVTVGESKTRKLQYRLTRDGKKNKWVVDDVLVKQNRKDVSAAKSVTEQMDLLLSVRDFLAAWEKGDRDAILAVMAPGSAKLLSDLPPEQLKQLAAQTIGDKPTSSKLRPEAQLDGNDAIVRLKRATGEIVLTYRNYDGHWKVTDAAVEHGRKAEQIPSVMKTAGVLRAVNRFLAAYRADDKNALKAVCTEHLFNESLKFGDLKSVPLPTADGGHANDKVHINLTGAEFVYRSADAVLRISLNRKDPEADSETPAEYLVQEVTVYDATQEKRLSALFTSRAVMELFSKSLAERELERLRKAATADFNRRVWDTLDPQRFAQLSLPEIEAAPPRMLSTEFHGELIEITVQQGSRVLTYVLRDWQGRVCVDDVLMPVMDRPNSLKTTLEIMLPVYNFHARAANRISADELVLRFEPGGLEAGRPGPRSGPTGAFASARTAERHSVLRRRSRRDARGRPVRRQRGPQQGALALRGRSHRADCRPRTAAARRAETDDAHAARQPRAAPIVQPISTEPDQQADQNSGNTAEIPPSSRARGLAPAAH